MPIGATIGAAVVGAGATTIAGNKAASAQEKAAQQSSDVQRYMYDTSRADSAPYRAVGASALGKLARMYGVGGDNATDWEAYVKADPAAYRDWQMYHSGGPAVGGVNPDTMSLSEYGQYHYRNDGARRDLTPFQTGGEGGVADYGGFTETPGYAFRRDEAMKAIERMGSARGARFNPQTWKAGARYADNLASSEYENYANALRSMAGIGQTATAQSGALGAATGQSIGSNMMAAGNARASSYANTGAAINNFANNALYASMTGGFGGGNGGGTSKLSLPPYMTPGGGIGGGIGGGQSYPGYGLNPNFA